MNEQSQDMRALLLRTNGEFHRLSTQHHELEARLGELSAKPFLSEPEQIEETDLKKRKLQLKDRMESMLREHRSDRA